MTDFTLAGLPLHILLIHAVVVLVPLTALAVVLHAAWPAAHRRLGVVTPLAGLALVALVPLTVAAGDALAAVVGLTPAVQRHADLGRTLLPWVVGLFLVGALEWTWFRFFASDTAKPGRTTARAVRVGFILVSLVVATGAVATVVIIGEAGTRAVWGGVVG